MSAVTETGVEGYLLERDGDVAILHEAVSAALSGTGALVLVEAAAGLGKTELLTVACEHATRAGLDVHRAHGGQVEREVALSAARQLFAPVAALPADERKTVLAGAAALAAGPLGLDPDARPAGEPLIDPSFADFHGLYWLTANLAARKPLLLAVDDAHWLDPVSLRWLVYLAQRLEGVPVVVVVAARPHEPDAPAAELAALASDRLTRIIRPEPLSDDAAASLVEGALGPGAEPEFSRACREVTAGNPFYLRRLVDHLVHDGVEPTAEHAPRLRELGPETIARSLLWRLASLPPEATALAQAVAILERDAELRLAAGLAGLTEVEAASAADALAGVQVLSPSRPLSFVHPVVRSAFYGDLPVGERAQRHASAARLLRAEGASSERVAAHLVLAEPAGDPDAADSLRAAAQAAADRGATAAAATYLERALAEPPAPEQRAELVLDHARVLVRMHSEEGPAHLAEALELIDEPIERIRVAQELGVAHLMLGQLVESRAALEKALADLGDRDRQLALEIEVELLGAARFDHTVRHEAKARLVRLAEGLGDKLYTGELGIAERQVIASLAFDRVSSPRPYTETAALALRALGDGELLAAVGPGSPAVQLPLWTLCFADHFDAAQDAIDVVLAEARRRGSLLGFSIATTVEATVNMRRGRVRDAEASARASTADKADASIDHPLAMAVLVDALTEQGRRDEAWSLLENSGYTGDLESYPLLFFPVLNARGRLKLAGNDLPGGIEDLLGVGRSTIKFGTHNGTFMAWRTAAAIALEATGDHDQAVALAHEALVHAEGFGSPRAIGIALRGIGIVERDTEFLERSIETLEGSGAQLELAYSYVELGAALRHDRHRKEAREPLARAVDLAERCGATVLAERAAVELKATGAKPRRRLLSGVESLTASERRIAQMAVTGMTNRDIAQALFVTVKTVESHMVKLYRKLDVHSRAELADAMAGESAS